MKSKLVIFVVSEIFEFSILCTDYPRDFDLDKSLCKSYFKEFGKVKRIVFIKSSRAVSVEYVNERDFLNALNNAGEYNGEIFTVRRDDRVSNVKKVVKPHSVSYIDVDEVNEELAAMVGYSKPSASNFSSSSNIARKLPKLNRVWQKGDVVIRAPRKGVAQSVAFKQQKTHGTVKKNEKKKIKEYSAEQQELISVIKMQAKTVEEKCRVLDARDKLLKHQMKATNLKSGPTIGTCPDMCPEKERLMRVVQHQVSIYEQDNTVEGDKRLMNPKKAVKQYSRSSADQESPLPHELRCVAVLQMTMNYLMSNIMNLCEAGMDVNVGEWFHFLWDRTRSIRKDITQQNLCCQGSVELVEQCARFHIHCSARLMGEDPSVFDQKINTENLTKCLQTLKYMYHDLDLKNERCPHEAEFRAYIILLNLNDGNFMWEVQKLRLDIQKSPEVKFALQIYSAFDSGNYVKFFKLVKSTTYLNTCLLMRYFLQVRVAAIKTLIRCFTPPKSISFYPIKELTNLLYLDNDDITVDFMQSYGLVVNKDSTHFLIERSSFMLPDFPYVLDRSELVERKKEGTVGKVVCGQEISPEIYMSMSSHEVQNSFDENGYLRRDSLFPEIEQVEESILLDTDSEDERIEETPSMIAEKPQSGQQYLFAHEQIYPEDGASIKAKYNTLAEEEALFEAKENIFSTMMEDTATTKNIFDEGGRLSHVPSWDNIFAKTRTPTDQPDSATAPNIFGGTIHSEKSSILNVPNLTSANDFVCKAEVKIQSKPVTFNDPRRNVFAHAEIKPNIFAPEGPKKGGFTFNLPQRKAPIAGASTFLTSFKMPPNVARQERDAAETRENEQEIKNLEAEKARIQEELRIEEMVEKEQQRLGRIQNDELVKKLEGERLIKEEIKKLDEDEVEKKRREEEEKIKRKQDEERRQKEEKSRQEAELRKRELERQVLENRRLLEIEITVNQVVSEMVDEVETQIREGKLAEIRRKIQNRSLVEICHRWKNATTKKVRKRKAADCASVWINPRNIKQCAEAMHTTWQDATLSDLKRYKSGKPRDLPLVEESPLGKVNLFQLTYSTLRRRLVEIKEKWHQHIYWKVVVSLPDRREMDKGLNRLENILNTYLNWNETNFSIENHKTITYCLEKQQGLVVRSHDANGYVFLATNIGALLQQRIFANLKDFGVFVKMPVAIILKEPIDSVDYMENLKESGVVSDYIIYSCNLTSSVLPSIMDNAFVFLSKMVEKSSPLKLDTLGSLIDKCLCSEIWEKASTFAKWNSEYKVCMRNPNVVIDLYNEGLGLLTSIVFDENLGEYAQFPDVFVDYLPDRVPDFLPCNYRYFPHFLFKPSYQSRLKTILENLRLPQFKDNWPPKNQSDLLLSISKYCKDAFEDPKKAYIAVLNSLEETIEKVGFEDISWIAPVEILAKQKLGEQNLDLDPMEFNSPIYRTLITVYHSDNLNKYTSSDWFYRNNRTIEAYKKTVEVFSEKSQSNRKDGKSPHNRKRSIDSSMEDNVHDVIQKAEQILRRSEEVDTKKSKIHSQMDLLNKTISDLEDSIKIIQKVDQNFLRNLFD